MHVANIYCERLQFVYCFTYPDLGNGKNDRGGEDLLIPSGGRGWAVYSTAELESVIGTPPS